MNQEQYSYIYVFYQKITSPHPLPSAQGHHLTLMKNQRAYLWILLPHSEVLVKKPNNLHPNPFGIIFRLTQKVIPCNINISFTNHIVKLHIKGPNKFADAQIHLGPRKAVIISKFPIINKGSMKEKKSEGGGGIDREVTYLRPRQFL